MNEEQYIQANTYVKNRLVKKYNWNGEDEIPEELLRYAERESKLYLQEGINAHKIVWENLARPTFHKEEL